jgi:hypothetical protein
VTRGRLEHHYTRDGFGVDGLRQMDVKAGPLGAQLVRRTAPTRQRVPSARAFAHSRVRPRTAPVGPLHRFYSTGKYTKKVVPLPGEVSKRSTPLCF